MAHVVKSLDPRLRGDDDSTYLIAASIITRHPRLRGNDGVIINALLSKSTKRVVIARRLPVYGFLSIKNAATVGTNRSTSTLRYATAITSSSSTPPGARNVTASPGRAFISARASGEIQLM